VLLYKRKYPQGQFNGVLFVMGTFPATVGKRYASMMAESAKEFSYLLGALTESA
jgi:hypothetical protein